VTEKLRTLVGCLALRLKRDRKENHCLARLLGFEPEAFVPERFNFRHSAESLRA